MSYLVSLTVILASITAYADVADSGAYATCAGRDNKGNNLSLTIFNKTSGTRSRRVFSQAKLVVEGPNCAKQTLLYSVERKSSGIYEEFISDENSGLEVYFGYDDADAIPTVQIGALGSQAYEMKCHRDIESN